MKRLISVLFAALPGFIAYSQMTTPGSAEIYLRMKKLGVLGSVLYIAAHPDDENTRLLTYLSKDKLYRTGYLSMTRGDGGQNLIGDEQGVELGLIRTQELLSARKIDGAEQFFARAFDFGFTKTTDEAMRTWGKQKILSDVVWVIRKFQPDVIITRFPEDNRAGHGHHSASAVLAHEAFKAAADPNQFPEQFQYGVHPWQAKRLLWNTFNFGNNNTTSEDQLKLDVGTYNPVLGKSYGEIAAESRSQHKSQGFGVPATRGSVIEYFSPVSGEPSRNDILDGVTTDWSRVEGGAAIQSQIDALIQHYDLSHPEKSIPSLVKLYQSLQQLKEGYWKSQKIKEIQQLIVDCSGLWLEAVADIPYAVQGDSLKIAVVLNNRLGSSITLDHVQLNGFDSAWHQDLTSNKNFGFTKKILISDKKPVTQPYWLEEEMSPGSFNVKDQLLIGSPQSKPAYEAVFVLQIDGQNFEFTRPVVYKFTDPVKGEQYQPLTILPAVTGQFDPELVVFKSKEEKEFEVHTRIQTTRSVQPTLSITPIDSIAIKKQSDARNQGIVYSAHPLVKGPAVFYSDLLVNIDGHSSVARQLRTISYDHIPRIDYFVPARARFVMADVQTAGKRIGYIEGAGDKVPEALRQMGYEVVLLKEKDINDTYLKQFDAVLTGVRAYNVHPWLADRYEILMDYVKQGGNLVVQYNRNIQETTKAGMSPYPFRITANRVTDENATVRLLVPDHPVFNFPNIITPKDFEGWIQERGIYFADQLDPKYQTVLSMNDPGDAAQDGSLIISDYGQGKFVYTGLVFFRELPAGVPGAYRLLANIIALNHKKGF